MLVSIPLSRPLAICCLFICIAGVLFAVAWKPSGPAPAVATAPAAPPSEGEQRPALAPAPKKAENGSSLSAFYAGAADDTGDSVSSDDVPAPDDAAAPSIAPPNVTIVQQPAAPSQPPGSPTGPVPANPIE